MEYLESRPLRALSDPASRLGSSGPQGDTDCITRLVCVHSRFVVASLRHNGVTAADAEDVAQEVFIACCARPEAYQGRSSLRAWLQGICRNKARDYWRKRQRRCNLLAVSPLVAPIEQADPCAELLRSELGLHVRLWLHRLPACQREVLVLHEMEDIPMAEIAARLGCPLETAYSRYRAGRAKLRSILRRELEPRCLRASVVSGGAPRVSPAP